MSRTTAFRSAALAALVLIPASVAGLSSGATAQSPIEGFDVTTIGIETGSLDRDGSPGDSTDVEIQWFADYTGVVAWTIEDPAGSDVEIVEYAIKVSEDAVTREYFTDGGFTNGDDRFMEMRFLPDQVCNQRICRIELEDDFFVPGNVYEVQIFALERSGNSTYQAVELEFPNRRR